MAHSRAVAFRLFSQVALLAEGALHVLNKARVGQLDAARVTPKALGMPACVERFDDTSAYEELALAAHGREQQLKVVLAKFPPLELVVDAVRKRLKALSAP